MGWCTQTLPLIKLMGSESSFIAQLKDIHQINKFIISMMNSIKNKLINLTN